MLFEKESKPVDPMMTSAPVEPAKPSRWFKSHLARAVAKENPTHADNPEAWLVFAYHHHWFCKYRRDRQHVAEVKQKALSDEDNQAIDRKREVTMTKFCFDVRGLELTAEDTNRIAVSIGADEQTVEQALREIEQIAAGRSAT